MTHQELLTQFLVEGVWEELCETGEDVDDVEGETAVVSQHQQQRSHRRVHHLHVDLEARDELQQNVRETCEQVDSVCTGVVVKIVCVSLLSWEHMTTYKSSSASLLSHRPSV